jgi:hypothetical protein
MKHYKRTIKHLRKRKEWQNKFLEYIALKFSQAKPSTLKLRLIHIKRRFFSSGDSGYNASIIQRNNTPFINPKSEVSDDLS